MRKEKLKTKRMKSKLWQQEAKVEKRTSANQEKSRKVEQKTKN